MTDISRAIPEHDHEQGERHAHEQGHISHMHKDDGPTKPSRSGAGGGTYELAPYTVRVRAGIEEGTGPVAVIECAEIKWEATYLRYRPAFGWSGQRWLVAVIKDVQSVTHHDLSRDSA